MLQLWIELLLELGELWESLVEVIQSESNGTKLAIAKIRGDVRFEVRG